MSDYLLRPAIVHDEMFIRALIRREHLDPFNVHWQNFLVAEANDQIIGIGQVKPFPGARELGSLAVVPEYRRSGVGGAIIHALVARESGPLVLFCLAFRERYYAKFGFRRAMLHDVPGSLKAKYILGLVFTRLFRERLIVMVRPPDHLPAMA